MTGAPAPAAQTSARHGVVGRYLVLACVALLPGVLLRIGVDAGAIGLSELQRTLADIKFGSGARFWLGVTGTTIMGLLLLYPLRKALTKRLQIGSIGSWFHAHILIGLGAPVLILYHCNFGYGGSNANVALWSMLLVVTSGIAGFFVYGRASRDFYASKQRAEQHRNAILAALCVPGPGKSNLIATFDAIERELLKPRQGIAASLRARYKVEYARRLLAETISSLIDESARNQRLADGDIRQVKRLIGNHFRTYVGLARAATSQSVREQLWARWRLFHLPLFLIMVMATVLHVIAVWDWDGLPHRSASAARSIAAPPIADPRKSRPVMLHEGKSAVAPAARITEPRPVERQQSIEASRSPTPDMPKVDARAAARAEQPEGVPVLVVKPQAIGSRAPANTRTAAKDAQPTKSANIPASNSVPITPSPQPASEPDIKSVYAELQRRTETAPMALGGARPRTLNDQIAELKAKFAAKQFFHSEPETGFALTGKHLKEDCTTCHKAPLREARSPEPRQCIDCHKDDDIHKGRQPNCTSCHTTNRWSQILRRK